MNWTRGRTLGCGSTATVFAATSSVSGEIFAVKSAEFARSEFLQREQIIMSTLSSPWIVGYKGYDVTRENDYTVMFNLMLEYMPGGTLLDGIRLHGGRFGEPAIGYYTKQIVQGLEYLHSRGIVHCDIKSRNILLCNGGAKIADFGCAKCLGDHGFSASNIGGTPMFMAPEVVQGKEQGFPADIWALGCTVIEMATGGSPWPNATSPASVLYQIAYSGESPEIPNFLSEQAKDFLEKCLKRNPEDRWTAEQLLSHPFLLESNPIPKPLNTSSPTSILDQGVWNSMDGDDLIRTPNSLDSASGRLSKLCWEADWEWNDDDFWTTVRGGDKETGVDCGSVTALSSNGMEVEMCPSTSGDKLLLLNYTLDDNVSCSSRSSCSAANATQQLVVINNINFERRQVKSVKQLQFL